MNDKNQPSSSMMRYLTILWAVYYFTVFTIGQLEGWKRPVIWIGGTLIGMVSIAMLGRRIAVFPREAVIMFAFIGWAFLGGYGAMDETNFWLYMRLVVQLLVIMVLLSGIIMESGAVNIFWRSFIGVAIFLVWSISLSANASFDITSDSHNQQSGLLDNANGFGYLCFVGILGAMAFFGEMSSWRVRALCVLSGGISFYGIILSASRGAFIALLIAMGLWPIMCFNFGRRRLFQTVAATILVGVFLYWTWGWVEESTYVGSRMGDTMKEGGIREDARYGLLTIGLKLLSENPLLGVGIGQFEYRSKQGMYAHNEWIELLSTTGVVGFALYMSVFLISWRRLTRAVKILKDPVEIYRANFMRLAIIVLVVSGAVFRPNFVSIDSMFMIALIVGMSRWAEAQANLVSLASSNLARGGAPIRVVSTPANDGSLPVMGAS